MVKLKLWLNFKEVKAINETGKGRLQEMALQVFVFLMVKRGAV